MKYQITTHRPWHVAKQGLSLYYSQKCSIEEMVTIADDSSSWSGVIYRGVKPKFLSQDRQIILSSIGGHC